MSRSRFRDDEPSSTATIIGVVAAAVGGFALGMYVAQRVGGFGGLTSRFKRRKGSGPVEVPSPLDAAEAAGGEFGDDFEDDFDDIEDDNLEGDDPDDDLDDDEFEGSEADQGLEERVLEAFRNDPILAERAVDIGSLGNGNIELAGWVETEAEAEHAVTIARGVPGVDTVVTRLATAGDEVRLADIAHRGVSRDPTDAERWGRGKRRMGVPMADHAEGPSEAQAD